MKTIIVNGRWAKLNGDPLTPMEVLQLPQHFGKISGVLGGENITHSKVNAISRLISSGNTIYEIVDKILSLSEKEFLTLGKQV